MEIYKVHILDNTGNTNKILIFSGNTDLETIETQNIFSNEEREYIQNKQIVPIFLNSQIHPDDSIRVIKKKIIMALESNLSYDELYLFSHIQTQLDARSIYDSIYKKGKDFLDLPTFSQLLKNYNLENYNFQEGKTQFYLEDLETILPKTQIATISLGIHFASKKDESFVYNPFTMLSNYMYEGTSDNALLSLDNRLLMNCSNKIINNVIYLCLASNVFDFLEYNENNVSKTIPLYYPLLAKQTIYDKPTLLKKQNKLLRETQKILDKKSIQLYENVDLLYTLFSKRNVELPYIENGIKSIQICIHPEKIQLLPLDAIFKNIHASKTTPFIKYNPGVRRENIYRLFSNSLNKYGSKIPFLKRTKIIQLSKDIGKNMQISFYIPYYDHGKLVDILLTFTQNSNIYVECMFEIAKDQAEINTIFSNYINPVIQKINHFLNQTGYQLNLFNSIVNDSVEIVKIKYFSKISGNIKTLKEGYISAIFDVVEDNVMKGAILKYKRVENYEEMDAETSLIMNWFMETERIDREELITRLMDFSNIEREEALIKINHFLGNHTVVKGKYVNSSENILENAGFLTKFGFQYDDGTLYVEMENIHSMDYIPIIQIYIDSIFRLKLFPENINIDKSVIENATKQITNIKNIDKPHIENVVEVTKAKPLTFGKVYQDEEDNEGLIFYDEDEEDEQVKVDSDSDFFTNLDEYEDAVIESDEIYELPQITKDISKDIDEPEEEGLIFNYYEESEEEDDEDKIPEQTTGGDDGNDSELDGLLLREKNNNLFLKRLKRKDPTLYLTTDIGKQYSRYSRLCQSFRQPVAISDEEKQKIDENYEGSYTNALQYGTDPTNKSWYICPRFWCLKTNTSITEEQVKSGMCGKIIPQDAKVVPKGHYVYEFEREKHDSPGFLTADNLHPDGHCLPCCFKNWDSKLQRDIRNKCNSNTIVENEKKNKSSGKNLYILKIEAIPIEQHRYGFLPLNIQRFFKIDYSKVVEKDNLATILKGETLLRYGVPQSKKKSFIGCISDIYSKKRNIETLSIKEMCLVISDSISIDLFIKVHNGSLPSIFNKNETRNEDLYLKYLDKQPTSVFINSINLSNPTQTNFLQQTLSSYENFLDFINDENSLLDYTYLWDIICTPNPKLFEFGLNIVVLDVTQNDVTDNVEIICPSASYSTTYYDPKKKTIILLKNEEIFEPIYLVNTKTEPVYSFIESIVHPELKQILQIIRKTTQNYCAPISSIHKYEFKRNKMAEEVRLNLLKFKYTILFQIQNLQGKTIGFEIEYEEKSLIVPCFPSGMLNNIPTKYIDDCVWYDYEFTRDALKSVYTQSNGAILVNPEIKVIEDGLIVGMLTETNQFIQIDPPSENIHEDHLKEMKGTNYLLADVNISFKKEDEKRVKTIKMIQLESQFYSSFRSLVRVLLNSYENKNYKKELLKYIENQNSKYTYLYCLKSVEYILRKMCEGYVEFLDYEEDVLMTLTEITNCQDDDYNSKKYCITRDSLRVFIIPKNHLISGLNNEVVYFGRISDELLRYKRIQSFILEPNTFLNISKTNYSILENEMILLESLITKDYFEDLIPRNQNNHININYDNAHPKITEKYSNKVDLTTQEKSLEETSTQNEFDILCIKETIPVVGNKATNIWIKRFPSNAREIIFNESRECSFYPIIHILRDLYKLEVTIPQIKLSLRTAYNKYLPEFQTKIIQILRKQGKKTLLESVSRGTTTLEETIISEGYYITNLDLWVLADSLNLPIVLFTSNKLKNLVDSLNWLVLGGKYVSKYYFIRAYTEPLASNQYSDYHMITPTMKFSEIKGFQTMVEAGLRGESEYAENVQKLSDFLMK